MSTPSNLTPSTWAAAVRFEHRVQVDRSARPLRSPCRRCRATSRCAVSDSCGSDCRSSHLPLGWSSDIGMTWLAIRPSPALAPTIRRYGPLARHQVVPHELLDPAHVGDMLEWNGTMPVGCRHGRPVKQQRFPIRRAAQSAPGHRHVAAWQSSRSRSPRRRSQASR